MNKSTIVILVFLWGLFVGWIAVIAGCHTIHGFGSDLKDWSSKYVERNE